jgi:hypothetical protein
VNHTSGPSNGSAVQSSSLVVRIWGDVSKNKVGFIKYTDDGATTKFLAHFAVKAVPSARTAPLTMTYRCDEKKIFTSIK